MLGIVILNYNTWKCTERCIESVIKTCFLPYKIYIVDNHSDNYSFEKLSNLYRFNNDVCVIENEINGGYSKGNNIGIKAGISDGCDYLLITNNDIVFKDNCIHVLHDFIQKTSKALIVGPKIYDSMGDIQHSTIIRRSSYWETLIFCKIFKCQKIDESTISEAIKVYSVSGCCFMVRAKEFVEIGAFDEGTFLYNEENILSFQARQSGYNIYFLPTANVIHEHGATTGKQSLFIKCEFLKSSLYYWYKYRKINDLQLVIMWIFFVSHTMVKSIFCRELQNGRIKYFTETWKKLQELISRRE